ncbi:YciI family protein [Catellatospora sp. KI3]|uniref:YciI family protein n=1 Tax=Catellatospora sp. KI3 TaxID=3041620 RepID=UPI0024821CB8|nr:YciI family protein [Catellatospora sp. KI3]MDI1461442.1 YciI family protein [Catellatospora sp. KI3]
MKYAILINHNKEARDAWQSFSAAQRSEGYAAHQSLHDDLENSGEMVAAEALADPSNAKRVLVSAGSVSTTDGPFDQSEHLAGIYLIDVENVERAVEYAARIPEAAFGLVEVRPVLGASGADM